ncbi:hypothetical protein BWI17_17735 [Betaproteobacteria bacterium GR16-43]|nr:hypothetical protein BWI17_17735 [Betaproteobacteria bacterium GR16-43]
MRNAGILLAFACAVLSGVPGDARAEASATSGGSSPRASAAVRLAVVIPRVLQLRLLDHPNAIDISAEDVARGYVVIQGPRIDILANLRGGFLLRAELRDPAFTEMELVGLEVSVRAGAFPQATRLPSNAGAPRREPAAVAYRLRLAPSASVGRHAWPVALTVQDS